jgi:hypothetical protein
LAVSLRIKKARDEKGFCSGTSLKYRQHGDSAMKRVTLSICAIVALAMPALAGTKIHSSKNPQAVTPECPQWHADTEFKLGLSGMYAFTANSWQNDLYLNADHAWEGAIDAKYFFRRYFGVGVQGTLLAVSAQQFRIGAYGT